MFGYLGVQTATLEHEYHEPRLFVGMSLPVFQIPRCSYFDAIASRISDGVVRIHPGTDNIWVTIILSVFHDSLAVFGDGSRHEFSDHAIEIRGREHVLKTRHLLTTEFSVNE